MKVNNICCRGNFVRGSFFVGRPMAHTVMENFAFCDGTPRTSSPTKIRFLFVGACIARPPKNEIKRTTDGRTYGDGKIFAFCDGTPRTSSPTKIRFLFVGACIARPPKNEIKRTTNGRPYGDGKIFVF